MTDTGSGSNWAVQILSRNIADDEGAPPTQSPDHAKTENCTGEAVRVTRESAGKGAEHMPMREQSIPPGDDLTEPRPLPVSDTVEPSVIEFKSGRAGAIAGHHDDRF